MLCFAQAKNTQNSSKTKKWKKKASVCFCDYLSSQIFSYTQSVKKKKACVLVLSGITGIRSIYPPPLSTKSWINKGGKLIQWEIPLKVSGKIFPPSRKIRGGVNRANTRDEGFCNYFKESCIFCIICVIWDPSWSQKSNFWTAGGKQF